MSNLTLICCKLYLVYPNDDPVEPRKFLSAFSALAPEVARSDKRTRALPRIESRRVLIWLRACCQGGISARQDIVGAILPCRAAADLAMF